MRRIDYSVDPRPGDARQVPPVPCSFSYKPGFQWRDYAALEEYGRGDEMVATLLMLADRFTEDWIVS